MKDPTKPPAPTPVLIVTVAILELLIVFCAICGIGGVIALLNLAFRLPLSPFIIVVAFIFAFVLSFLLGGLFSIRGIGRGTVIFAGLLAYLVSAISFLFGRGLVLFPLCQVSNINLGVAVSIGFSFFLWVLLFVLIAYWIKNERLQLLYAKIQKITIPILVFLVVCGVVYVIAIIAVPYSAIGKSAVPTFDYSIALQQRSSAYQKEHYAWQVIPDEELGDIKMQITERLGHIWSYNYLLFGSNSRLESGSFSVRYNEKYGIWLVETYPRKPIPYDRPDSYTHLLVRGSDGLVLAKW